MTVKKSDIICVKGKKGWNFHLKIGKKHFRLKNVSSALLGYHLLEEAVTEWNKSRKNVRKPSYLRCQKVGALSKA